MKSSNKRHQLAAARLDSQLIVARRCGGRYISIMIRVLFLSASLLSLQSHGEGNWHRVTDEFPGSWISTDLLDDKFWKFVGESDIVTSKKTPYTFQYYYESENKIQINAMCAHLDLSRRDLSELVFPGDGGGACFLRAKYDVKGQRILGVIANSRR